MKDKDRVEIPLTNGGVTYVSPEDAEWVKQFRWYGKENGHTTYIHRTQGGKQLHRLILDATDSQYVDHIDGNGSNNCKDNLRLCTIQENNCNCRKRENTSSQYKGVSWCRHTQRWKAYIQHEKDRRHIGLFDSELDAAYNYNVYANMYYGKFARVNELPPNTEFPIRELSNRAEPSSKHRGVAWHKRQEKWHAKINHQGKRHHIGYFTSELEAALAYNAKAKELHGDKAKLNDLEI